MDFKLGSGKLKWFGLLADGMFTLKSFGVRCSWFGGMFQMVLMLRRLVAWLRQAEPDSYELTRSILCFRW